MLFTCVIFYYYILCKREKWFAEAFLLHLRMNNFFFIPHSVFTYKKLLRHNPKKNIYIYIFLSVTLLPLSQRTHTLVLWIYEHHSAFVFLSMSYVSNIDSHSSHIITLSPFARTFINNYYPLTCKWIHYFF